jgi:hypothetical protein
MRTKKIATRALAALSLAGLLYCFAAYLYIQPRLTPAMPEPTAAIRTVGNFTMPALFLAGLYHILLLARAFRTLAERERNLFPHSLYMVAVVLSGATLLSDLTLLSDIGKEYARWDVKDQWLMLYGFTAFHCIVVACGVLAGGRGARRDAAPREPVCGSDAFFLTMHQIGAACGVLGIAGLFLSLRDIVPDRFRDPWMLAVSCLALFPLAVYLVYMIVRNGRRPIATWFDEKQTADTAIGALFAIFVVLPLLLAAAAVEAVTDTGLPEPFWPMLAFFCSLAVLSITALARTRMTVEA